VFNLVHGYGRTAGEALSGTGPCAPSPSRRHRDGQAHRRGRRHEEAVAGARGNRQSDLRGPPPDAGPGRGALHIFSLNGDAAPPARASSYRRASTTPFWPSSPPRAPRPVGDRARRTPRSGHDHQPTGTRSPLYRVGAEGRRPHRRRGRAVRPSPRVKTATSSSPPSSPTFDNKMRIAQEEIFGPAVCLIPFKASRRSGHANDVRYGFPPRWTQDSARRTGWRGVEAGMFSSTVRTARPAPSPSRDQGLRRGREAAASFETFCEARTLRPMATSQVGMSEAPREPLRPAENSFYHLNATATCRRVSRPDRAGRCPLRPHRRERAAVVGRDSAAYVLGQRPAADAFSALEAIPADYIEAMREGVRPRPGPGRVYAMTTAHDEKCG